MDNALRRRLIGFIDLTDLSEPCSEPQILSLCATMIDTTPKPAALCLWPQFVGVAQRAIGNQVPIATVLNFPAGGDDIERVLTDCDEALGDGADEIDLVFPYRAFLSGDHALASDMVSAVKDRCGPRLLKVILETGALADAATLRAVALCALEAGADFLKTSTGKIATGATPEAARIMLETIRDHGNRAGFKASGGIRTPEAAQLYLDLFESICGVAATPQRFRIGTSQLYTILIAAESAS